MDTRPRWYDRPTIPALILAAMAAAIGCAPGPSGPPWKPEPMPVEEYARPIPSRGPNGIWISPLGVRKYEDMVCVDLVIAGPQADRCAQKWARTPPGSTRINAVMALRRISPDPCPIPLRTDTHRPIVARYLDGGNGWRVVQPGGANEKLVLSVPLDRMERLPWGRYELRLLVPTREEATPWDTPDLDILIDEEPMVLSLAPDGGEWRDRDRHR